MILVKMLFENRNFHHDAEITFGPPGDEGLVEHFDVRSRRWMGGPTVELHIGAGEATSALPL